MSVDAAGDLVIVESGASRLRKVNALASSIATLMRTAVVAMPADTAARNLCALSSISGITADQEGNLFLAGGSRVCRYSKDGVTRLVAGSRTFGFGGDGALALDATFSTVTLSADAGGSLLLADTANQRIRKLTRLNAE